MGRSRKDISPEEIEFLQRNEYVSKVSSKSISFTEEFKRYYYEEHAKGRTARSIFIECGIDPAILGEARFMGIKYSINCQAKKTNGFTDYSKTRSFQRASQKAETTELRIKQLEHELAYTRQEVEFLKKLRMADMEAQKQWESKHRQQ